LPAQILWNAIDRFEAHIAAVELLQRAGRLDNRNLVVVLGTSTVEHGFDCQVLHANDPLHRYWLILGAGALNFAQLEGYARPLLDSSLKPSLVVIGLEPSLTHVSDEEAPWIPDPSLKSFPHDLRMLRIGDAIRDCAWLIRNRDVLMNAISALFYDAGVGVRALFDLPMSAAQPPAPDPWDVVDLATLRGDSTDVQGKWSWRMGMLTPSHFQSPQRSVSALVRLVAELRQRGATVVGLITPQTSRLRPAYPPLVLSQFDQALAAASAGRPLRVLDLRDSIPDDLFYDDAHVNTPGKRMFCRMLPALLQ
jgi:hypothetical protein